MKARRALAAALLALAALAPRAAAAWDVRCFEGPAGTPEEEPCADPFARARTEWRQHPLAEHRRLLERSMSLAGIPDELTDSFDLTVYTGRETLEVPFYTTIRPVPTGAEREQVRTLTVQMMANLPDFSYTLWDWASGNELCPPDPANPSALDCHNYETHIGWLNSQHMLPQARHWYGYLHGVALERAQACADVAGRFDAEARARFRDWLIACEKEALVIEAVAQHYLQDAWAAGHMFERWGGVEVHDFVGDRALGVAVGAFVGALHGSKAMLDDDATLGPRGPWDDPINAPSAGVGYVDPLDGPLPAPRPGVGDRFLDHLLGLEPTALDDYGAQREALFGCAVSGLRAVYGATAQVHGTLEGARPGVDLRRSVETDSCWGQRVTNRSIDTGLGVHRGRFDEPPARAFDAVTAWALGNVLGKFLLDAPQMRESVKREFQRDIAAVVFTARLRLQSRPDDTDIARGEIYSLAGIEPNHAYARGGAGAPPATYSDPPLPWGLSDPDPLVELRKQSLHLTFADAHAADRCLELTHAQLDDYRDAVAEAGRSGDPEREIAALGQCVQMVAPHLRFGVEGDHDDRRRAFCDFAAPGEAEFVYTGEDPDEFTGLEPTDLPSLLAAAREFCESGEACGFPPDELPAGSYQLSCEDCAMNGTLLGCSCRRIDGSFRATQLDVGGCQSEPSNDDGSLRCTACP